MCRCSTLPAAPTCLAAGLWHSIAHVSTNSVGVGLAQLAMRSCLETAGVKDTGYLIQAMAAFYGASFQEENGRFVLE